VKGGSFLNKTKSVFPVSRDRLFALNQLNNVGYWNSLCCKLFEQLNMLVSSANNINDNLYFC